MKTRSVWSLTKRHEEEEGEKRAGCLSATAGCCFCCREDEKTWQFAKYFIITNQIPGSQWEHTVTIQRVGMWTCEESTLTLKSKEEIRDSAPASCSSGWAGLWLDTWGRWWDDEKDESITPHNPDVTLMFILAISKGWRETLLFGGSDTRPSVTPAGNRNTQMFALKRQFAFHKNRNLNLRTWRVFRSKKWWPLGWSYGCYSHCSSFQLADEYFF